MVPPCLDLPPPSPPYCRAKIHAARVLLLATPPSLLPVFFHHADNKDSWSRNFFFSTQLRRRERLRFAGYFFSLFLLWQRKNEGSRMSQAKRLFLAPRKKKRKVMGGFRQENGVWGGGSGACTWRAELLGSYCRSDMGGTRYKRASERHTHKKDDDGACFPRCYAPADATGRRRCRDRAAAVVVLSSPLLVYSTSWRKPVTILSLSSAMCALTLSSPSAGSYDTAHTRVRVVGRMW